MKGDTAMDIASVIRYTPISEKLAEYGRMSDQDDLENWEQMGISVMSWHEFSNWLRRGEYKPVKETKAWRWFSGEMYGLRRRRHKVTGIPNYKEDIPDEQR